MDKNKELIKEIEGLKGKAAIILSLISLSILSIWGLSYFAIALNHSTIIKNILIYLGFLSAASLLVISLVYYLSRAYSWIGKTNNRMILSGAILLAIAYSVFTGLKEGSILTSLANLTYAGLMILALPFISKLLNKKEQ